MLKDSLSGKKVDSGSSTRKKYGLGRSLIERIFNKIKNLRRVATSYDELAVTFLSFVRTAAIYLSLK